MENFKKFLICPITQQIMFDPVQLSGDKKTYEREAIIKHLARSNKSPMTNLVLASTQLEENEAIRNLIRTYLDQHPEAYDNDGVHLPQVTMLEAIQTLDVDKVVKLYRLDKRFLTAVDGQGFTVFHHICQLGSMTMLTRVLSSLNEVQQQQLYLIAPPARWQPKYLNQLLLEATKAGQEGLVRLCLNLGADINVSYVAEYNGTPLHLAVKYQHTTLVNIFIGCGAKLEEKAIDGSTPLNFAGFYGHAKAATLLINAGAALHHQDNKGNTPFHDAMQNGHTEVAKVFLQAGASRHIKNRANQTPIDIAKPELQQWLITEKQQLEKTNQQAQSEVINQLKQEVELLKEMLQKLMPNNTDNNVSKKTPGFFRS